MVLLFVPCERVSLNSMHDAASEPLSPFKTIIFDGPALQILLVQAPLTFEQMPKPLTFEQVLEPLTSNTDDDDAKIQTVQYQNSIENVDETYSLNYSGR